mgnify:CR=1 FL=1
MSKMKLQQILDYEVVSKITIENNLAPLSIEASPHNQVELICELDLVEPFEEFEWEDCVSTSCEDGSLQIVLEEVDGMERRFLGANRSFVKILVPESPSISVEMENLPVTFQGINNSLVVSSENAPIRIQDCNGDKKLSNENGPISIRNCTGNLEIELENGPLAADMISGVELNIQSENGPLKIREACFPQVNIESENGVIVYETLFVENARMEIKTENGMVHFVLPEDMQYEIRAETETGKIKSRLSQAIVEDGDQFVIVQGDGSSKITISTENGMIKIGEGEKVNLEFLKTKLEQLKESIATATSQEDMEKVQQLYANVSEYVSTRIANIKEALVKEKIQEQLEKLQGLIEEFDYKGAKDKTIASVEEFGTKVSEELRKNMEKLGTKIHESIHVGGSKHNFKFDGLGEYINKVINSSIMKPYLGGEMKAKEKEEVTDRSRLKILEMLEAGKISAEEAERLLKAMGK